MNFIPFEKHLPGDGSGTPGAAADLGWATGVVRWICWIPGTLGIKAGTAASQISGD